MEELRVPSPGWTSSRPSPDPRPRRSCRPNNRQAGLSHQRAAATRTSPLGWSTTATVFDPDTPTSLGRRRGSRAGPTPSSDSNAESLACLRIPATLRASAPGHGGGQDVAEQLPFESRRSPVMAVGGMVAASQPLAAQIGAQILARGGSAADAAVAPAGLTLELLQQRGLRQALPPFHALTVTVPGACAAWCDLVERHGRLPLAEVLGPSAELAERGFPVSPITAHFWALGAKRQLSTALGGQELTIGGRAPGSGEVFRNPGLARTLRAVAAGGASAYYRGEIGRAIAQAVRDSGGVLAEADLAAHRSSWELPVSTTYRGTQVWECGPNSQGLAALLALNILEGFELAGLEPLGGQRLHLILEALRLAFADARWFVADPLSNPAPIGELLSKEYAAARRALIDPRRANPGFARGAIPAHPDTVYLSVVDGQGNACSLINSNYMGFGTGIVPAGWGFSLQNRGLGFSLDPEHPNALVPS